MIEIEFEDPQAMKCDCCGEETTKVVRYVSQDKEAFAVYLASFTPAHEEKLVHVIIGLGTWGEDASPSERTAFVLKLWQNEEQWNVTILDKDESPWGGVEFLGKVLNRDEALAHPWVKDIYHITDHIVDEDKPIIEYFNAKSV